MKRFASLCAFLAFWFVTGPAQPAGYSFLVHEGRASINGTRLYYKTLGTGPPLLVVHGGPGLSHQYFLPYLESLAQHYTLVLFDQRAHGLSSVPKDTASMRLASFVEDIEALRKKLRLGPINLLAHSWGTIVGMHYAMRYPTHLRSLILVSPVGASSQDLQAASAVQRSRISSADSLERAAIIHSDAFRERTPGSLDRLFRISFRTILANPLYADSLFFYFPRDYGIRSTMLKYLSSDLTDFDLYDSLRSVSVPTLLIHGREDATPLEITVKISDHLANCRIVTIERCGHFPFMEQSERFRSVVTSFLSSLR